MELVHLYPINFPLHFYSESMCFCRMRNYYIDKVNIHNFFYEIPISGLPIPQVISTTESGKYNVNNIPLEQKFIHGIKNLPEYKQGTYYIVGDYVAKVARQYGRYDCLVPYGAVIDSYNLTQVGFIGLTYTGVKVTEDLDSIIANKDSYCTEGFNLAREVEKSYINFKRVDNCGHYSVNVKYTNKDTVAEKNKLPQKKEEDGEQEEYTEE